MKFQIEGEKDAKLFVSKFPIFAAVTGSEFIFEIAKRPVLITICYRPKECSFEVIHQSAYLPKMSSYIANHTHLSNLIYENRVIINEKLKQNPTTWIDRHIFDNEPIYYALGRDSLHFVSNKMLSFSNIYNVKENF